MWRSASVQSGILLLLCLLQACQPGTSLDAPGAPAALSAFVTRVLTLHRGGASAVPGVLACFEWTGVTAETRQAVERSLHYDIETPIQRARLEAWNPSLHPAWFFTNGNCPNLEPEWILHLSYASKPPHELSLPVGRNP
jgi:hypothetical protein